MKSSKVLVTGATGFLGSYILRALLNHGYSNLSAIKRDTSPLELVEDIYEQVNWYNGNVLNIGSIEHAMQGVEYVIHSAASVSFNPKVRSKMYKTNIEGTANMVNIALEKGIKKFIHISSIAALGRSQGGEKIDEKTNWKQSKLNSHYGITKYHAELEVRRAEAEGLDIFILNPSYILGAGFWNYGPTNLYQMIDKGMPFYAKGTNGVVDARDVAELSIRAMESEINGKRMVVCAENMPYYDLFKHISDNLGKSMPKFALNKFLAGLAWRAEWVKSKLTGSSPLITRETVRYSAHDFYYDNSLSKELFNFEYRDAAKSLKEICEVYKESKASGKDYGVLN